MIRLRTTALILLLLFKIYALDNGQALTPPLVISTFSLGCNFDQNSLRVQIDQAGATGLINKGFKYMVLEDCWQGSRNLTSGKISYDIDKFPKGLLNFITYANGKGIKVGLGTDIGQKTKLGKSGSLGYEKIDALTYAEWGIEWVSIGNSQSLAGARPRFTLMSEYLQETGRKMIISINNNNKELVQTWGSSIANCWDSSSVQAIKDWQGLGKVLVDQMGHERYAGSGSWNDAGFLSSSLPYNEFLAQLAAWIALKAPLKLQAPLNSLDSSKLALISNEELLQISRDQLKKQATLIRHQQFQKGWQQVWGGPLSGNRYVLVFINGLNIVSQMSVSLSKEAKLTNIASYWIRDPVSGSTIGSSSSDTVSASKVGIHSAEVRVLHL